MRPLLPALLIFATLAASPRAGAEEEPTIVEMTVSPAHAPTPSLRHRFMPDPLDLHEGNAAVIYLRAMLIEPGGHAQRNEFHQKVHGWADMADQDLPRKEVREAIKQFSPIYGQLEIAVARRQCDWDLPIKESEDPFSILLPELNELRNWARLLRLKARLERIEGRLDRALATLQVGMTMGRHAGSGPTLIHGLVGISITNMMLDELRPCLEAPQAPNLYWALTVVPSPWIDLNPSMAFDVNSIYLMFPGLRGVRERRLTDDEWKGLHAEVVAKYVRVRAVLQNVGASSPSNFGDAVQLAEGAVRGFAALGGAGKLLVAFGYDAEEVRQMPMEKMVLLHDLLVYETIRDGLLRWFSVPYHQLAKGRADERMEAIEIRGKRIDTPDTLLIPNPRILMPAVHAARIAEARLEREFAALRIIEALRMHAAAHGGKLPERLDDVTAVPIPLNPLTGEAFGYELKEGTAILTAAGQRPVEYRIRLREAK